MALSVEKGTITAPTVNASTSTVNLASDFDLKAVILWATTNTTAGQVDGNASWSQGFVTNDGGSVQQGYLASMSIDAGAASDTARGLNTTFCLKGYSDAVPTTDYTASCTTFSPTQFVLTWADAPTTAIIVHYLALGGADIAAARVGTYTLVNAAAQNVAVNAGFGQPDLVFFMNMMNNALTDTAFSRVSLGVAKSDTERRHAFFADNDAAATMTCIGWQGARANIGILSSALMEFEQDLDSKLNWPVDGFRLLNPDQATTLYNTIYLAIRGRLTATVGSNTAPTAAPTVVQDLAHGATGGTPKAALFWGIPVASVAGPNTTDADLGGWCIGAYDGTNQGAAGWVQKDNDATASTGMFSSSSFAFQEVVPVAAGASAPTVASEATASVSGTNISLSWADTDTVAREYNYLLLGDAQPTAAGPQTPARRPRGLHS